MRVKLIKHLRVHYHRVFRNRTLVQESQDTSSESTAVLDVLYTAPLEDSR